MTPNQKYASRISILIVLVSLGVLAVFWRREPAYRGRSLSQWVQQYKSNCWNSYNVSAAEEARFAIQQIGTDAIPYLLDLMRQRDSVLNKKLRTILPPKWHQRLHLRDSAGEVRRIGAYGLAALGTNAAAAVPAVIDLAKNHADEDGRYMAVFALRNSGSPASEATVPFLLQCLTNSDATIRGEAAIGLGTIRPRSEVVLPALIQYLEFAKTPAARRFELLDTLHVLSYRFGNEATSAVPHILPLLNHPDWDVRQAVTNDLPRIDAAAAAKAHVTSQ